MPGPIAAWGRSTGAIAPCCSLRSASGSSSCSAAMKPRRSVVGALSGRGRRARTIEEARAFVPLAEHSVAEFAAHRPRRGDRPTRPDHPFEQRLPARRAVAVVAESDCLNA